MQGSILRPLLFIVYVNDPTVVVDDLVVLYADDTSSVLRGRNYDGLTDRIENNLEHLNIWFENNNLKANANKTYILLFNGAQLNVLVLGKSHFLN